MVVAQDTVDAYSVKKSCVGDIYMQDRFMVSFQCINFQIVLKTLIVQSYLV